MVNDFKNALSLRAPRAGLISLLCMILFTITAVLATCPTSNEDYIALFG